MVDLDKFWVKVMGKDERHVAVGILCRFYKYKYRI